MLKDSAGFSSRAAESQVMLCLVSMYWPSGRAACSCRLWVVIRLGLMHCLVPFFMPLTHDYLAAVGIVGEWTHTHRQQGQGSVGGMFPLAGNV